MKNEINLGKELLLHCLNEVNKKSNTNKNKIDFDTTLAVFTGMMIENMIRMKTISAHFDDELSKEEINILINQFRDIVNDHINNGIKSGLEFIKFTQEKRNMH